MKIYTISIPITVNDNKIGCVQQKQITLNIEADNADDVLVKMQHLFEKILEKNSTSEFINNYADDCDLL